MRKVCMVRKVDRVGRVVLPKELRAVYGIEEDKTVMEIFTEEDEIILKKYEPSCIFCREVKGTINFRGKLVCKDCLKDIKNSLSQKR